HVSMLDDSHVVSRSVIVHAPADELFAVIADPYRHHEFDGSGTVRKVVRGPRQLTLGDTFSVRMKMFGIPYSMTSTATRIEPGRVVEWQPKGGQRWRYELEPIGPEETRVTETFEYGESWAPKLMDVLGFPRRNVAGIEQTLENLARLFA